MPVHHLDASDQKCWSAENADSTPNHSSVPAAKKKIQYAGGTISAADEIKNCHSIYEREKRMFT